MTHSSALVGAGASRSTKFDTACRRSGLLSYSNLGSSYSSWGLQQPGFPAPSASGTSTWKASAMAASPQMARSTTLPEIQRWTSSSTQLLPALVAVASRRGTNRNASACRLREAKPTQVILSHNVSRADIEKQMDIAAAEAEEERIFEDRLRNAGRRKATANILPCPMRATLQELAFKEQVGEFNDVIHEIQNKSKMQDATANALQVLNTCVPRRAFSLHTDGGAGPCLALGHFARGGSQAAPKRHLRWAESADLGADSDSEAASPTKAKSVDAAARLSAKLKAGSRFTLTRGARLPMKSYKSGDEQIDLVDVETLKSKCKGMGQGLTVKVLLEKERRKEHDQRFEAVARAKLKNRIETAKASGVRMPSQFSYEQRLEKVYQRKFEAELGTMTHKIEQTRGLPSFCRSSSPGAVALEAVLAEHSGF